MSVFLPWYGLSFTSRGVAGMGQLGHEAVSKYGNALLQSEWGALQAGFSALAGRELGTLSAHQTLHTISVLLLVLAGVAVLLALRPLAGRATSLPEVGHGWIAAIGALAGGLVLYRIVSPPVPEVGFVAMSVQTGAWVALSGAALMAAGGLWPRPGARPGGSERDLDSAWSELSGWTPGA